MEGSGFLRAHRVLGWYLQDFPHAVKCGVTMGLKAKPYTLNPKPYKP